ncbi:hypothetical protein ACFL0C_01125 [Patescibacteria group bacterium]
MSKNNIINTILFIIIYTLSVKYSSMINSFKSFNVLFLEAYILLVFIQFTDTTKNSYGWLNNIQKFIHNNIFVIYFGVPFSLACLGALFTDYSFSKEIGIWKLVFLQYFYYLLISHLVISNLITMHEHSKKSFGIYSILIIFIALGAVFAALSKIEDFMFYYQKLLYIPLIFIVLSGYFNSIKKDKGV